MGSESQRLCFQKNESRQGVRLTASAAKCHPTPDVLKETVGMSAP
jgi:hypothetical protein